jgi:hypothetical protein
VIVHNIYVSGFVFNPLKADSRLVIYSDTVLPCPISLELFEPVSWRSKEVLQIYGFIEI